MPGSIIAGVMMVALLLSAVTVVTMSAPRTASAVSAQTTSRSAGTRRAGWRQLGGGAGVDVVTGAPRRCPSGVERQRLELALRAVADQRP
jgi:hypothetical protein